MKPYDEQVSFHNVTLSDCMTQFDCILDDRRDYQSSPTLVFIDRGIATDDVGLYDMELDE